MIPQNSSTPANQTTRREQTNNNVSPTLPYSWKKYVEGIHGTPPYERAHHSSIITDNDKLFIFGGHDASGNILNDLAIFDLQKNCWDNASVNRFVTIKNRKLQVIDAYSKQIHLNSSQELSTPPLGRAYHTAVFSKPNMIVVGGYPSGVDCDIYFLDVMTLTWSKFNMENTPPEVRTSRSQHSASMWNDKMVVFGGIHGSTPLNSLIIFDTIKFKWLVLPNNLPPTYAHSSFVRDDMLFVIGGCTSKGNNSFMAVSLKDGTTLATSNYIPKFNLNSRFLTSVYDKESGLVYIFGGYSVNADNEENGCNNTLFIVDMNKKKEKCITSSMFISSEEYPPPRCGHSMNLYKGKLIMFGGCDRLPLLNGEWVFCDFSHFIWAFEQNQEN
ncbi:Kelch motif family protein [Histomonas meleagridis]|uniref:Kelch motif family protein n=1 Tax=Histomonas meleagridis TaxID=135588 RepID=UPI00355A8C60|nr:Kelch motif family protein [Histomonas meleagridis]KAH0804104.1 Kelch motif family protein [Histomonas meleagridis]